MISGGEKVYPAEVERVLAAISGVRDVAVVGSPDEKWGEIVVSLEPSFRLSPESAREMASAELARYKLPQRLYVVDALPSSPKHNPGCPPLRPYQTSGVAHWRNRFRDSD